MNKRHRRPRKRGLERTQWGGAAALRGFLYQLLASAWYMAKLKLEDVRLAGQEIQSARMILEPSGGGDSRYYHPGSRVIEQYKTRAPDRPWSLRELITDVLPDLFIAVDPHQLDMACTYRFVTAGRCGRLGHFQRFLQNFTSEVMPDNPLDVLDDTKDYPFFNTARMTDRALFLHIANQLKSQSETLALVGHHRKLWHLLARFEIRSGISALQFERGIDEFLLQIVERREDVEAKRDQLCMILMKLAA